jgi:hypothetical protein
MRYWLVGEAPTRDNPDHPEDTVTPDDTGLPTMGNRLLAMTGWTKREFLAIFEVRTTVWKRHWPLWMPEGKQRARQLVEDAEEARGVVLVGHMAAAAFGLGGETLFQWFGRYAVVPHPAPTRLNRYWNLPGMREKAAEFFGGILEAHHESSRSPRRSRAVRRA